MTLCFTALVALTRFWELAVCGGKEGGGGLPGWLSRFVAAVGVGALLDPYLLFFVDLVAGNYNCSAKCTDYTSPTCSCHEGDARKLYVRLEAEESAGVSGAFLTIIVRAVIIVGVTTQEGCDIDVIPSVSSSLFLYKLLFRRTARGRIVPECRFNVVYCQLQ